ncbi:MAG: toll/interleukin-1 receptor domain-containing protein, partial [Bacteroidales bacterium]|nr:toll/interleukin-1 receptor domain-containing protein [Bacteroidales bacterium]
YLIVICSPNSARSEWVSNEVKAFIEMGRLDRIIPLIVDGTPHSYTDRDPVDAFEDECFPKSLRQYTKEHPEDELLGVSIPEVGKEKALVRIVSKMLGVGFDSLWDRHKRLKRRKTSVICAAVALAVGAVVATWMMNKPFDADVVVAEGGAVNSSLPQIKDVVVRLDLGSEVKVDTLSSLGGDVVFRNIPARFKGKEVHFTLEAPHCEILDTTLALQKSNNVAIRRDPSVYGHICAKLYSFTSERPARDVKVRIAGIEATTDNDGVFEIDVPIESQAASYTIESEAVTLLENTIYMPCQSTAVIEVK